MASRSRVYALMTDVVQRTRPSRAPRHDDLIVDRRQGIAVLDEGKRRAVARFETELRRLLRRARANDVKVVVMAVPCNLRDWRPERSVIVDALPAGEREAWMAHWTSGRNDLEHSRFAPSLEHLLEARDGTCDVATRLEGLPEAGQHRQALLGLEVVAQVEVLVERDRTARLAASSKHLGEGQVGIDLVGVLADEGLEDGLGGVLVPGDQVTQSAAEQSLRRSLTFPGNYN